MVIKSAVALFLCMAVMAGPAMAESKATPTTNPTTQPTTKPAFPSPAELLSKWKQEKEEDKQLAKVAYFNLTSALSEKPSGFSFFNSDTPTLRDLIARFKQAAEDKEIVAVLITLGADSAFGMTQVQELREGIAEIRRAGKKVFVFADSYDTVGYMLASAGTNVCMLEAGEIIIPGVGFETMFYRGAFDKLGIHPDYIQIGEFKGAEEPYTRKEPSPELRGEMEKLTEAIFTEIVDTISLSRSIPADKVRQLIDDTMMGGAASRQRGLVDHLVDQDGLRDLIAEEVGTKIDLVHDYGAAEHAELDLSNPFSLLAAMAKKPVKSDKPEIALIYADGVIVDGEGGGFNLMGGESQVASEAMRKEFREAMRDDNIKAVVIRIDSPGGSALASEVMWQSVRRLAKVKPVYISVGGMAASGGYYLASAGEMIYADQAAIVGSIGVVGGKLVMKDLFDKVGLTTETFSKGRNAGLYSSNKPWDDRQRRLVRTMMQETYDQFTQRIMTTRKGKIDDIDKVARGRIFTAKQAKELGMVDEIGSLATTLNAIAAKVKLEQGTYDVRVLPAPKTLADFLNGSAADAAFAFKPVVQIKADSVLGIMPKSVQQMISRQVTMMQILDRRPVMLMSPVQMNLK